ncbi:hypothetical protein B0H14DRAFT_2572687 [Mycena olivaceomarginata]|nr:hypothetical protein B0H14DRAFT_2572687 [Mycena olivaceomarginata]
MDKGCDRIIANLKNMKKENSLSTLEAVVHCDDTKGQRLGIVTVPVQDSWTDGQTDNRPVPSLGYWSPQHAVLSPDGRIVADPFVSRSLLISDVKTRSAYTMFPLGYRVVVDAYVVTKKPSHYMSDEDWDAIKLVSE